MAYRAIAHRRPLQCVLCICVQLLPQGLSCYLLIKVPTLCMLLVTWHTAAHVIACSSRHRARHLCTISCLYRRGWVRLLGSPAVLELCAGQLPGRSCLISGTAAGLPHTLLCAGASKELGLAPGCLLQDASHPRPASARSSSCGTCHRASSPMAGATSGVLALYMQTCKSHHLIFLPSESCTVNTLSLV